MVIDHIMKLPGAEVIIRNSHFGVEGAFGTSDRPTQ
jgi:hypothetical protein